MIADPPAAVAGNKLFSEVDILSSALFAPITSLSEIEATSDETIATFRSVVRVNVINCKNASVQITKSAPTLILKAPSVGKASPALSIRKVRRSNFPVNAKKRATAEFY